MPLELPIPLVVVLNAIGIPVLQMTLAWCFNRMPATWFEKKNCRKTGGSNSWYEQVLRIKSWKRLIPDGASWFSGGFSKASLSQKNSLHLSRFITETRRGEACHWAAMGFTPLFFLWNPIWADLVMAAAMAILNVPCIAIQRYNRSRLQRVMARSR